MGSPFKAARLHVKMLVLKQNQGSSRKEKVGMDGEGATLLWSAMVISIHFTQYYLFPSLFISVM